MQIGLGVQMYADDNRQFFPDPGPPGPPSVVFGRPSSTVIWGITCGGEWFASDRQTPNTPAPMIQPLSKKTRSPGFAPSGDEGMTYTTAPGTFDPTITGFLSYGLSRNRHVFCLAKSCDGNHAIAKPRHSKSRLAKRQSATALCDPKSGGVK